MRHGDEQAQALEWAYAALTGDQAVADALGVGLADLDDRVWTDQAPPGTAYPFLVLSTATAVDRPAIGDLPRLNSRVALDVRAVAEGTAYDPLKAVTRAVYARLHGALNEPLADGGTMLTALRVSTVQYPERTGGVEYRHLGQEFQVEIN